MAQLKYIGVWTVGLMSESSEVREEIEQAFQASARIKDDSFYSVEVDGRKFFVADNGEFGYTAMLPEEY